MTVTGTRPWGGEHCQDHAAETGPPVGDSIRPVPGQLPPGPARNGHTRTGGTRPRRRAAHVPPGHGGRMRPLPLAVVAAVTAAFLTGCVSRPRAGPAPPSVQPRGLEELAWIGPSPSASATGHRGSQGALAAMEAVGFGQTLEAHH